MDFERFLDLLRALASEGIDYALVSGVALNLHGIVRATEDVDLFIRPSGDNVDRLKRAPGLALERPGDRRDQRGGPPRRLPDNPVRPAR